MTNKAMHCAQGKWQISHPELGLSIGPTSHMDLQLDSFVEGAYHARPEGNLKNLARLISLMSTALTMTCAKFPDGQLSITAAFDYF
jgi:hypothetical protein